MTVVGTEAWIGGVITKHASNPEYIGLEAVFRVADNGNGGSVDQISLVGPLPYPGGFEGTAEEYCVATPPWPDLLDLEAGRVRIEG